MKNFHFDGIGKSVEMMEEGENIQNMRFVSVSGKNRPPKVKGVKKLKKRQVTLSHQIKVQKNTIKSLRSTVDQLSADVEYLKTHDPDGFLILRRKR